MAGGDGVGDEMDGDDDDDDDLFELQAADLTGPVSFTRLAVGGLGKRPLHHPTFTGASRAGSGRHTLTGLVVCALLGLCPPGARCRFPAFPYIASGVGWLCFAHVRDIPRIDRLIYGGVIYMFVKSLFRKIYRRQKKVLLQQRRVLNYVTS